MSNDPECYLTLRQADQARTDFAIIEDELEAIYARVARLPSRGELWRVCLSGVLGGSVLATALGFGVRPALIRPAMTKFSRMALEAAAMAVLAGLLMVKGHPWVPFWSCGWLIDRVAAEC
jgi:hypothetical protein